MRRRKIYALQAAYYMLSGAWPLLSMSTFLRVTGAKTDLWLVKMVGCLALGSGLSLAVAARERSAVTTPLVLSAACAMAFAGIDVIYALRKVIGPIYLADAAVEAALLAALALA